YTVSLIIRCARVFYFSVRHHQSSTRFPYTTLFRSVFFQSATEHWMSGRSIGFRVRGSPVREGRRFPSLPGWLSFWAGGGTLGTLDRKSTRLNSSHGSSSYAVFCLKKKNPANIK